MSDIRQQDVHLSDAEETDLSRYRAVSPLAIVSLVLGLLSPVAMIMSPLLWIVPVLATLAALGSLWTIARNPGSLSGRGAALVGLALGLMLTVALPARSFSRDWILGRRAARFATDWLQMVQEGNLEAAHQLTLPNNLRRGGLAQLEQYYKGYPIAQEELDYFFSTSPADRLAKLGSGASLRCEGPTGQVHTDKHDLVSLSCSLHDEQMGRVEILRFLMVVQRSTHQETGQIWWRVIRLEEEGQ